MNLDNFIKKPYSFEAAEICRLLYGNVWIWEERDSDGNAVKYLLYPRVD